MSTRRHRPQRRTLVVQARDLCRIRLSCSNLTRHERRFSLPAAAAAIALEAAVATVLTLCVRSDLPAARQSAMIPVVVQERLPESSADLAAAPVPDALRDALARFEEDVPIPALPPLLPPVADTFAEIPAVPRMAVADDSVPPEKLIVEWPDDAVPDKPVLVNPPPHSSAPAELAQGAVSDEDTSSLAYWSSVRDHIAQELRYPSAARRRGIEGTAAFRVSVDTNGNLVAITDLTPEIDRSLRQAGVNAIRRALPFAALAMASSSHVKLTADVPIRFRLVE